MPNFHFQNLGVQHLNLFIDFSYNYGIMYMNRERKDDEKWMLKIYLKNLKTMKEKK